MATQQQTLTGAEEKKRKQQLDADNKRTAKYKMKIYLRDYAELDGLHELLDIIKERRQKLTAK